MERGVNRRERNGIGEKRKNTEETGEKKDKRKGEER